MYILLLILLLKRVTVDRKIFMLKVIPIKQFMVLNFRSSFDPKIFLTVDGYNKDKRLVHALQEPSIAGYNAVAVRSSRRLDIYLRRCGCVRTPIC